MSILGNHLLAVIHGEVATESALRDLKRCGFDHPGLLSSIEIEATNPLSQLFGLLANPLSEEASYLAQYREATEAGQQVIAVTVKEDGQMEEARNILERYGASNIRFFGRLAVSDLSPQSNPSVFTDKE
jgi:hypothetical protein